MPDQSFIENSNLMALLLFLTARKNRKKGRKYAAVPKKPLKKFEKKRPAGPVISNKKEMSRKIPTTKRTTVSI